MNLLLKTIEWGRYFKKKEKARFATADDNFSPLTETAKCCFPIYFGAIYPRYDNLPRPFVCYFENILLQGACCQDIGCSGCFYK